MWKDRFAILGGVETAENLKENRRSLPGAKKREKVFREVLRYFCALNQHEQR